MPTLTKSRLAVTGLLAAVALSLAACGSPASTGGAPASSDEPTKVETVDGGNEVTESFKDGVLVTEDFTIKITDTKVIPVGAKGNEYGDKPVIAFWYDITNTGGEKVTSFDWIYSFKAFQDTDPSVVNELDVASAPDDSLLETQGAEIKKGATIQGAIAYELDDTTTPVELVASIDLGMSELGRQVFEIK